ncbi:MFS transporter [Lysinibacillus xylanilyticus]|uniref:MFS transporter n=1 Tax=Lysinibacillus xylanilyticus TaxID=582475 RepID=UPI002B24D581|nr:MFS transporter [Lysinibacillus xylanilyticus]MEB2282386.1 MFS transporter [Lysinibacillus xylanilyticus]
MNKFSKSFKALWIGEIVSEFGGVAGGIINGLLLYELTGSREWMGVLWLVYFIPSLILQGISAPFLNHVVKEKMLQNIQLIRAGAYILPLVGYLIGTDVGTILGLVVLQCLLGLIQPIYASLSFSLLPEICKEKELVEANALLDGTIRLMSFIAPGATSLLLLVSPIHFIYGFSSVMFLISFLALSRIPQSSTKKVATWTKKFWWAEMKEGYRTFFKYPNLFRLTILSSTVQFAVGATMVLSIPFIRGDLNGHSWEYAIFSGSFPVGYAVGIVLLTKLPKTYQTMYLGLIGGGLSFVLLFFVNSVPIAWVCELFGGMVFPLFNAQSAAIFQREAPRDRLTQLSAVRLLFTRVTMPLGILFASSTFLDLSTRQIYAIVGMLIVLPGLFHLLASFSQPNKDLLTNKK